MTTSEIYEAVEAHWRGRIETQNLQGDRLREAQADFFTGAMAALVATGMPHGEAMPPRWVVPLVSQRLIEV